MSGVLIQILAFSLPASTLANIMRNQDMIPHGKDKEYAISVLAGAVVNIVLNLLLIQKYKSVGVSIATVCAEFAVFFVQWLYTRKSHKYFTYIRRMWPFLLSSCAMAGMVIFIGSEAAYTVTALLALIALGIITFSILMLILSIMTKDELFDVIKHRWRK